MNTELNNLLDRNGIDNDYFEQLVYDVMILSCFRMLCKLMKDDPGTRQKILDTYRRSKDNTWTTKTVIKQYTGCQLSDREAERICLYLFAFFRKSSSRYNISPARIDKIDRQQNHRCNICGRDLRTTKAELDHIIPWELVGDELDDNYQLICQSCNRRKSNRIDYALCKLFLKEKIE